MVELNLKEIIDVLGGKIFGLKHNENYYSAVCTDTRKIEPNNIFFALKGANFNGNLYVKNALELGSTLCIVDELHINEVDIPKNASVIVVDNTELALGALASYYIKKLKVKTIGVTGSVGKTSTKDMLAAALNLRYKVLKTNGNFNNHIGLPLTIFRLDSSYDVAILEMGMSNAGEIEYLANISNPDIAVITNIGLSHIENLLTQENILKAKLESTAYFNKNNTLIVNGDDKFLNTVESNVFSVIKTGFNKGFDVYAKNISIYDTYSTFTLFNNNKEYNCKLELPGKHNITNYLLAIAVANKLGVDFELVSEGIKNIEKTSMRLDMSNYNGYTVINDCYNSSPDSMKSALDVQFNLNKDRNIVVAGDMYELGNFTRQAHTDVAEYMNQKGVDMVYTTGNFSKYYKEVLKDKCKVFDSKDDLILDLKSSIRKNDVILIKASRGARFEEIAKSILR